MILREDEMWGLEPLSAGFGRLNARPARRRRSSSGRWIDQPGRSMEAFSILAALGVLALSVTDFNSRYRSAIAEAERSAQAFAAVLAEDTGGAFEAVERTLRVAEAIRGDDERGWYPTAQAAHQALRQLQRNSPALVAIEWTNASGDLVSRSYDHDPPRANIADLPYFAAQRDGAAAGFFISPAVCLKDDSPCVNAISLPSKEADGGFSGVIVAEIDPSYLARIYQSIKLGANGSVTILRRDGQIVMREPFDRRAINAPLPADSLLAHHLTIADAGAFESSGSADSIDRIVAYQTTPGLPLVAVVSYDLADILRPWWEHVHTTGPLVAALIGVMLVGTLFLSRRTRQLARQTALLQATLENMDQGLVVVDEEGTIAICNRKAMALLDLPASLMNARPRTEDVLAYQAARAEFIDPPCDIGERRSPVVSCDPDVCERKRPNGIVLEIQTVPFGDGSAVRTYKDITRQKKIEQELKDEEARYRLLADCAADMIFRLDLNFIREYVSPASQEILGYAPEELIGTKPMDMIHAEDVDRVVDAFRLLRGGLDRASVSNRIRHRDGRWIWVEAELRLLRDAGTARPSAILGALRDVSTRKAVEAEAIAARRLAEQAAAAQSQFLATMSHELRTPLNSVLGFAGLILDRKDLAPDVRRQLGLIETASASLLLVVNDILDFSKIEEGKLELCPAAFSLAALVEDSISIVRGAASKSELEFKVSLDRDIPPRLLGDDGRLRQILLNLLNNAVKFTQQGYVALAVQKLGACEAGNRLRFVISDTGIGIARDKIGRLFERFSQVDGSTSRQYGGTGLGLAICKRLVALMGGEIGVDSAPGEGSAFWFVVTFPAVADAYASEPPWAERGEGHAATILLVEDVQVNQEIACSILRSVGHIVDAVSDGADAITAVQSRDYDVVLMDIQMPGMDGVTATHRIRALPGSANRTPIIAMTANVLPQQIAAFHAAGMNDHVGKPYKREDLFAAIDRCLRTVADNRSSPLTNAGNVTPRMPVLPAHGRTPPSPAARENDPFPAAAFDAETFETIARLLGQEKIAGLLKQLAGQLQDRFTDDPASAQERLPLAREAHKLVSSAGMLGFVGLSQSCAQLESVLTTEEDASLRMGEVREACRRALAEIAARMNQPRKQMQTA
jgi:PAS domain S-box-containing protein